MTYKIRNLVCAVIGILLFSSHAMAGAKINITDDSSMNIGGSLRTEAVVEEGGAPSGDDSFDVNVQSFRLYMKSKVTDRIGFNLQTEWDHNSSDLIVLDGYATVKLTDSLNLMAGRFVLPSDRSNLSGSYNLPVWDYPGVVSKYPSLKGGRDDGIAVWGAPGDGTFVYSLGVFDGNEGEANVNDNPLITGRLAVNFWDKEGYLTRSTYYGAKDILSLGVVFMQQNESLGDPASPTDFSGYNVDFMLEKALTNGGVGTVEAAYYNYGDFGGEASKKQGDGYLVSLAYLLPGEFGPGRLQSSFRFQSFSPDGPEWAKTERWDVGLTSVIRGHGARVGLYVGNLDEGAGDKAIVKLGLQLTI